jgi:excisionase family DNA binding protein
MPPAMPRRSQPQSQLEVSVDTAAKSLGVSERMVLNYIKARQIKALRVGKRWFVDLASLEAFRQASGLTEREPQAISETSEISEISETLPKLPEATGSEHPPRPRRASSGKNLDGLACYRLCLEAFRMPMWGEADKLRYGHRLRDLQGAILEQLGSGFYSYGAEKRAYYDRSRGLIGAALALVYSDPDARLRWASDVAFLEGDVLPAFASLIKKIERGQDRDGRGRRHER